MESSSTRLSKTGSEVSPHLMDDLTKATELGFGGQTDGMSRIESQGGVYIERPATNQSLINLQEAQGYKVYKRRWIGLVTLMLMNIMISWGWITFAPVSTSSQTFFKLSSVSSINWLSTVILFAYIAISPLVIFTLHRYGVKTALYFAALFSVCGAWIRYIGARIDSSEGGHYGVVMFGQILIGFAQPFVLGAPAYYSDIWFTSRGRVTANALISLSNPLGAALGQLVDPFLVSQPSNIPSMLLYVAIITTVVTVPILFVKSRPPTPPCPSSAEEKVPLKDAIFRIAGSLEFWLIFILFSILVGFFNASSSLLNQILEPYGFSEDEAGIGGAILIVSGLVASAIVSPIIDRSHSFMLAIRLLVPIIAACYIALIFAPQSRSLAPPYIVLAILGASSFSLLPLSLEFTVEITHPVSPELTSTLLWGGGQLFGAIFIIVMTALGDRHGGNMKQALIFEAIVACFAAIAGMCLGWGDRSLRVQARRITADKAPNHTI